MPRIAIKTALVMIAATFVVGCTTGTAAPAAPGPENPTGTPDSPVTAPRQWSFGAHPIDYNNPVSGKAVALAEISTAGLKFQPMLPKGLGVPKGVYVTDGPADQAANFAIGFAYETPEFGQVAVIQALPELTPAEWDADMRTRAEASRGPDTHGYGKLVWIRGGKQATFSFLDDGTLVAVIWLENGVQTVVRGRTLTEEQALKIVEGL